jgi:hypothetical protein
MIEMVRGDVAVEFYCERCGRHKKSKSKGTWTTASEALTICNGCYGELLSKGEDK